MNFSNPLPNPANFLQESFKIEACKFDGSIHRTWNVQLESETAELWVFKGVFEKEINHPLIGVIRPETISVEFYWKNRCYNVFRFHDPDGQLRLFYCNVNLPPVLTLNVLKYVDLDIDVLVQPDFSYRVIDLDEFAENSVKHRYPNEIIKTAQSGLDDLISLIENRLFPFNS